jgi:hypothetical protein
MHSNAQKTVRSHTYLNAETVMSDTFLTTDQLAERIHYDARTIRTRLKDAVLFEGVHYIRPFGGRKLLFIWEAIERDISKASSRHAPAIPMANGGVAHA